MKLGIFLARGEYIVGKPMVFEAQLPDSCHIIDSRIRLGHKTAELKLTVVHDTDDKIVPMTLIALALGQEHDDVREYEFVGKTETFKFTSEIESHYLFTAPREDKPA